jgi:DNA-binding GntR family transcriptional regulator
MYTLQPIDLLPAKQMVAAELRKAIFSHALVAGERVTLEGIADQLGISKTPVREAFHILANEGLLELHARRGAVIKGITIEDIRQHYEVRAILESGAAVLVCKNRADLTEIETALEKGKKLLIDENFDDYEQVHDLFHKAIWSATGNKRLEVTLSGLWNSLSIGYMELLKNYAEKSVAEHTCIYESLLTRNEEAAGLLMKKHIERSMHDMLTHSFRDSLSVNTSTTNGSVQFLPKSED